jgi:two-component system OmpR family sensor kinase
VRFSGTPPPRLAQQHPRVVVQRGQLPTPFVFAELAPSGKVLRIRGGSSASGAPRPVLHGLNTAAVQRAGGKPFTVPATTGGAGFRVRAMQRPDGPGSIVVGMSLQSVEDTVGRLQTITWLVALGVLAVLAVLAAVAVRIGLRPLASVERTAEDIAAGDLSRRVPPGSRRTEIGRLSAALNVMLAQIESAVAASERSETALRQFLADASHELRTPLTTVRGYAELARKGAFPSESAEEHGLERIEAEASRMGGMVDDLLLLAYLDQNRPLRREIVDLAALTADAVADARVRAPDRRIDYAAPDAEVLIDADADRTRQVLANLLGNAVTHPPAGTPVRVVLRRVGDEVTLEVVDDGPGLAAEQVGRLFERFYRVDVGRSRALGGSGLGLAIVQAIVQASSGSVRCVSEPGRGTSFVVTWPVHTQHSADLQGARS